MYITLLIALKTWFIYYLINVGQIHHGPQQNINIIYIISLKFQFFFFFKFKQNKLIKQQFI